MPRVEKDMILNSVYSEMPQDFQGTVIMVNVPELFLCVFLCHLYLLGHEEQLYWDTLADNKKRLRRIGMSSFS
jgi:hypothetical protein